MEVRGWLTLSVVSGVTTLMLANWPEKHSVGYMWAWLWLESILKVKTPWCPSPFTEEVAVSTSSHTSPVRGWWGAGWGGTDHQGPLHGGVSSVSPPGVSGGGGGGSDRGSVELHSSIPSYRWESLVTSFKYSNLYIKYTLIIPILFGYTITRVNSEARSDILALTSQSLVDESR